MTFAFDYPNNAKLALYRAMEAYFRAAARDLGDAFAIGLCADLRAAVDRVDINEDAATVERLRAAIDEELLRLEHEFLEAARKE